MPTSLRLSPSKNSVAVAQSVNKVAIPATANSVKQFDPNGTRPDVIWAFVSPNLIVSVANVAGV